MHGQIKPKDQARHEFNISKLRGDTVAYAEQAEKMEDVMKVELGNFPPSEILVISFSYVIRLDIINEVFWAFRIPATLTPRYDS